MDGDAPERGGQSGREFGNMILPFPADGSRTGSKFPTLREWTAWPQRPFLLRGIVIFEPSPDAKIGFVCLQHDVISHVAPGAVPASYFTLPDVLSLDDLVERAEREHLADVIPMRAWLYARPAIPGVCVRVFVSGTFADLCAWGDTLP